MISSDRLLDTVAKFYRIDKSSIINGGRHETLANARHAFAFIAYYDMGLSTVDIAKLLKKDRTTIYNSIHRVNDAFDTKDYLMNHVNAIRTMCSITPKKGGVDVYIDENQKDSIKILLNHLQAIGLNDKDLCHKANEKINTLLDLIIWHIEVIFKVKRFDKRAYPTLVRWWLYSPSKVLGDKDYSDVSDFIDLLTERSIDFEQLQSY